MLPVWLPEKAGMPTFVPRNLRPGAELGDELVFFRMKSWASEGPAGEIDGSGGLMIYPGRRPGLLEVVNGVCRFQLADPECP